MSCPHQTLSGLRRRQPSGASSPPATAKPPCPPAPVSPLPHRVLAHPALALPGLVQKPRGAVLKPVLCAHRGPLLPVHTSFLSARTAQPWTPHAPCRSAHTPSLPKASPTYILIPGPRPELGSPYHVMREASDLHEMQGPRPCQPSRGTVSLPEAPRAGCRAPTLPPPPAQAISSPPRGAVRPNPAALLPGGRRGLSEKRSENPRGTPTTAARSAGRGKSRVAGWWPR